MPQSKKEEGKPKPIYKYTVTARAVVKEQYAVNATSPAEAKKKLEAELKKLWSTRLLHTESVSFEISGSHLMHKRKDPAPGNASKFFDLPDEIN